MKTIYFVTEGITDQIVLEGLISLWMGKEDYIPTYVQPPVSAYAESLDTPLSQGWRGVLGWCAGKQPAGKLGRDFAIESADCLIVHLDADVARDPDFHQPFYDGPCPPARGACDWVRGHVAGLFDAGVLPPNAVLCVPSKDLEAWVLCSLHPDKADLHMPIECRADPGALLVQLPPYRLVRAKDGSLKKDTSRYRAAQGRIVSGWWSCAGSDSPRCPEAARFEAETRDVLRLLP